MRVTLKTSGPHPVKGLRVRIGKHVYIVTEAHEPTHLDEVDSVTDCEVQPADESKWGPKILDADLVHEEIR